MLRPFLFTINLKVGRAKSYFIANYAPESNRMKFFLRLANVLGFSLLILTACQKKDGIDKPDPIKVDTIPKYIQTANVYVAGSTYDSLTYVRQAAYWKNDVAVILTHGTKNAAATDIAVVGDDVYTAGYTTDANGAYIATYWKNSVQTNLTTNATSASAGSIVINGNDVYIAGFVGNSAVYWKNGQRVTLPLLPGMNVGSSAGIAIQGSDIYVSGYQLGARASAVYWKNGVAVRLPNDSSSYAGKNIVFHNNNMYVPASYVRSYSKNTVINYWKNAVPFSLADGTIAINAVAIEISDDDVYLACNTSKGAGYFKNNKLTLLSESDSEMTGLAVLDNDVYSSGQSTYKKKSVATVWKNNVPIHLSSPIGRGGFASAIVVMPLK